jgi:nicotinamidase-related amidase
MKTALILIDIQKDYFPRGRMEVDGAVQASEAARSILTAFRKRGLPIAHIQHVSIRKGAAFLLPDTEGIDFHENVKPLSNETVMQKNYPNSFRETGLAGFLEKQNVTKLVICGMMSHMCVDSTARAAFDKGYECIVAHDACATRSLTFQGVEVPAQQVHAGFMAALGSVFARMMDSGAVVAMLQ